MASDIFGTAPHDPGGRSKPKWPAGSTIKAIFGGENDCYRYELSEVWNLGLPLVMFLMMNPSVAGIEHSDPTLRKTGDFARSWGYGGQLIGNVHAYRATNSKRLVAVADPVGPANDASILRMALRAQEVVLAFGQPPKPLRARSFWVIAMLRNAGVKLTYLRLAKGGTPYHPLYLPGSLTPEDYVHGE